MSPLPADGRLPPYSTPMDARRSVSVTPPFHFEGMTARVFPLRANLDSLQRFCDSYLNIIPPEIGRFRAPVPYVYLMLLNYGRMAIDVANEGWLAQREVLFNVAVEWYRMVNGRWVFHDWATIAPFIFVDNDLSAATGRGVYGWPKTIANLRPTASSWMQDPTSPDVEATLSTMVFPQLYMDEKLEDRVFLEMERDAPVSSLRLPPDPNSPLAPWVIASRMAEALAGFSRDYVGLLRGLGIVPMHPASDMSNYQAMMGRIAGWGFPLRRDYVANTLNLKQFRSSQDPECYCFQALTNGPMRFTDFNRAGMLGESSVLAGDVSGGFSIRLHRWPSLPIVETLGLEVARRWTGAGCEVVQLKPVLPFWYDVNMEYLEGHNLAWRSQDATWQDGAGRVYPRRGDGAARLDKLFNTTLGAFNKALAGPFRFTGTTVRVLPLLAERARLDELIRRYLNEPLAGGGEEFEIWAAPSAEAEAYAYVYLTATVYGDVTSRTNNVGDWADAEVAFMVPVLHWHGEGHQRELCGAGLVPVFTYADSATAVAAGAEVLGLPMARAEFEKPASAWMTETAPGDEGRQKLLRLQAEVLPALGEGQKSQMRTILEISAGGLLDAVEAPQLPNAAARWARLLKRELSRKRRTAQANDVDLERARALSLELLGNRVPLSVYTLKQLRDVSRPNDAAYQSLVGIHRTLSEVLDLREIEMPLVVRIQETPSQPLVSTLGLVGTPVQGDGIGAAYALQPIRPFWLSVAVDEDLGERLIYRTGGGDWEPGRPAGERRAGTFLCDGSGIAVAEALSRIVDQGDPRRLVKAVEDWKEWRGGGRTLAQNDARNALRAIDPQMVVETLLSREWGNRDEDARWAAARRKLARRIRAGVAGASQAEIARRERDLFEDLLSSSRWPLVGAAHTDARDMLDRLMEFRESQGLLERAWEALRQPPAERRTVVITSEARAFHQLRRRIRVFLTVLCATSEQEILGEPMSPDAARDLQGRLREQAVSELQPQLRLLAEIQRRMKAMKSDDFREILATLQQMDRERKDPNARALLRMLMDPEAASGNVPVSWRRGVKLASGRIALQREALVNQISRGYQKPDFVIPTHWAGPERHSLFPAKATWEKEWYTGSEDVEADEKKVVRESWSEPPPL